MSKLNRFDKRLKRRRRSSVVLLISDLDIISEKRESGLQDHERPSNLESIPFTSVASHNVEEEKKEVRGNSIQFDTRGVPQRFPSQVVENFGHQRRSNLK